MQSISPIHIYSNIEQYTHDYTVSITSEQDLQAVRPLYHGVLLDLVKLKLMLVISCLF